MMWDEFGLAEVIRIDAFGYPYFQASCIVHGDYGPRDYADGLDLIAALSVHADLHGLGVEVTRIR